MKLVSIIVPVYNSEKCLEKCLNSIFNQTYKNIEVIALNDGSKDNSINILNRYENKYKNLIVVDKKNEGVSITRNKGIKMASGDYIMFIDNDDFIDEDYVEIFVENIKNYDIVLGSYRRINVENKILFQGKLIDSDWSKYIIMAPWAKIYKKEFLIKNKIEFLNYGIGEDVYFNLLAYSKNPKIKIIDYIGYNWFFNTKSISNTSQKGLNKDIDITYLLEKINKNYKNSNEFLNYYYIRYYIWYLLFSGRNSNSNQFIAEYNKIKNWFSKNNIKSNIFPFSSKLKGEPLKNRIIVLTFLLIEKLHLVKLFSKLYCRGGK